MSDFRSAEQPFQSEFIQRTKLFEMMEGKQIARAEHCEGERNPLGGAMFGLECTDGQRFVLMAIPDFSEGSQSPWKLTASLIADNNMIWSATPVKHFTRDRAQAGEMAPGWFQERVEGEVIEHMRLLPELTPWGGEQVICTLKNAGAFLVRACPPLKNGRHGYTANFGITFIPKDKLQSGVVLA